VVGGGGGASAVGTCSCCWCGHSASWLRPWGLGVVSCGFDGFLVVPAVWLDWGRAVRGIPPCHVLGALCPRPLQCVGIEQSCERSVRWVVHHVVLRMIVIIGWLWVVGL